MTSLITTYNPLPVTFTHGEGIWLYDEKGNAYLDSVGGIAVCGLGYAHPRVTETIQKQAAKLIHTSNLYPIKEQLKLAEMLTSLCGMEQAFFANSGAEANEAAIKLTRLYGHQKGIENPMVIVMENAFHGRTMATLTASGSRKVQAGFEPLVPGFIRAPFNDMEALIKIAEHRDDVVAIMLEPIQGEGGIHVAEDAWLLAVNELCEKKGWLLILDEVQTGNGRTGALFAFMHTELRPHILTTAKGLGNGIPISVCMMRGPAANLFQPGNHGSTFGGNPLAMATALTVLDVIEKEKLIENAKKMGVLLLQKLATQFGNLPHVLAIRGRGLMIGIELDRKAQGLRPIGLKHGILINVTAETVIRLLPPLIINEEEVELLVEKLSLALNEFIA